MRPGEPDGTVVQQAIEWRQRLNQREMDPASCRAFRAWMRSPENVEELARICLIDALLKRRSPGSEPAPLLPENVIPFARPSWRLP